MTEDNGGHFFLTRLLQNNGWRQKLVTMMMMHWAITNVWWLVCVHMREHLTTGWALSMAMLFFSRKEI